MEEEDKKPRKASKYKRGCGAGRLHLSHAAGERRQESSLLAMVCGEVKVCCIQSRDWLRIPTVKITIFVLTMDAAGHIEWPVSWTDATYRAALRKQAHAIIKKRTHSSRRMPPAWRLHLQGRYARQSMAALCVAAAGCQPDRVGHLGWAI